MYVSMGNNYVLNIESNGCGLHASDSAMAQSDLKQRPELSPLPYCTSQIRRRRIQTQADRYQTWP